MTRIPSENDDEIHSKAYLMQGDFDRTGLECDLPWQEQIRLINDRIIKSNSLFVKPWIYTRKLTKKEQGEQFNAAESSRKRALRERQTMPHDKIKILVDEALLDSAQQIVDYKAGKTKALMNIVGKVMKLSKGQADPEVAKEMIIQLLSV